MKQLALDEVRDTEDEELKKDLQRALSIQFVPGVTRSRGPLLSDEMQYRDTVVVRQARLASEFGTDATTSTALEVHRIESSDSAVDAGGEEQYESPVWVRNLWHEATLAAADTVLQRRGLKKEPGSGQRDGTINGGASEDASHESRT